MGQRVNAERLRGLGFPEKVIQEAVEAEKNGLFDLKPSPDLVERTMQKVIEKGSIPSAKNRKSLLSLIRTILS